MSNVGIRGVGGVDIAAGIGTIKCILASEDGHKDDMILNNVIYLPKCPKNIFSITQWINDRGENAGVFSREAYSILLWDDDKRKKLIIHPVGCPTPLMSVNGGGGGSVSVYLSSIESRPTKRGDGWKVDQQPTRQKLTLLWV